MSKFITQVPEGQQIVSMVMHEGTLYVATTHQVFILNRETEKLEVVCFEIRE